MTAAGAASAAEAETRDVTAGIAGYAESRCKDVIAEDLDFRRAKAKQTASGTRQGKRHNRMLHIFDYHRYKQAMPMQPPLRGSSPHGE